MRTDFAVKIRHADKPLAGAAIEIKGPQGTSDWKKFIATTGKDGIARISNLAPGDYWLNPGTSTSARLTIAFTSTKSLSEKQSAA